MTTEITVNYRPDGTCDYVTVQLPDGADAEQIAGIALVLATATENTDDPGQCGHQWVHTYVASGRSVDTTCKLETGHFGDHQGPGNHRTPSTYRAPSTGICGDRHGQYVCQLRTAHMSYHEDTLQRGCQWPNDKPGGPCLAVAGHHPDQIYFCQGSRGHSGEHEHQHDETTTLWITRDIPDTTEED